MKRNHVAGVLVAAMLLLSGCSAGLGNGGGTATDATAPGDVEPYVESGEELNATELSRDHESTLGDAGSFTTFKSTEIAVKGGMSMSSDVEAKIDAGDQQFWKKQNSTYVTQEVYTDSKQGVTYQKSVIQSGNETQENFRIGEEPYSDDRVRPVNSESVSGTDFIESFVGNVSYTMEGVEDYNGTTVTRFSASGADSYMATEEMGANQTVKGFNSTLLVAESGNVRYLSVELVVEDSSRNRTSTISLTTSWTDVGSTDVSEPAWTARAEERIENADATETESSN